MMQDRSFALVQRWGESPGSDPMSIFSDVVAGETPATRSFGIQRGEVGGPPGTRAVVP